jgi:hypothetical protein
MKVLDVLSHLLIYILYFMRIQINLLGIRIFNLLSFYIGRHIRIFLRQMLDILGIILLC